MAKKPTTTLAATAEAAPPPEPVVRLQVKKTEFLERVATRSGLKKSEARAALDAVLAELGAALEAGEELQIPPLGKVKQGRMSENSRNRVMMVRVVRAKDAGPANDPLAEPAEEG